MRKVWKCPEGLMLSSPKFWRTFFTISEFRLRPDGKLCLQFGNDRTYGLGTSVVHILRIDGQGQTDRRTDGRTFWKNTLFLYQGPPKRVYSLKSQNWFSAELHNFPYTTFLGRLVVRDHRGRPRQDIIKHKNVYLYSNLFVPSVVLYWNYLFVKIEILSPELITSSNNQELGIIVTCRTQR